MEDLEKQTSNQILAVIYPQMQSDSSLDDYCERVFRAWQVGQKDKNNGAVLFVFLGNHKSHIQTGYGLEGALPDATCKRILSDEMTPYFKANDFDGGMTTGVEAMIQATKGEYKGTGTTQYQREHPDGANNTGGISFGTILFLLVIGYIISFFFRRRAGGTMFSRGRLDFLWRRLRRPGGWGSTTAVRVGAVRAVAVLPPTAAASPVAAAIAVAVVLVAIGKWLLVPHDLLGFLVLTYEDQTLCRGSGSRAHHQRNR